MCCPVPPTRSRLVAAGVVAGVVTSLTGCSPGSSGADGPDEPAGSLYVALGDSFTAAPGVPVTETTSGCARSSGNYVLAVADRLSLTVADASCGGATTRQVTQDQQTGMGPVPPQVGALTDDARLVTIGLGANDHSVYATLFSTCVALTASDPAGAPCRAAMATPTGGDRLLDVLPGIGADLVAVITTVRDRAPDAEVVLVGYPQLVPASGTCPALPLAQGDYAYARQVWDALGDTMADAAEEADVTYLDLLEVSEGHDICAGADAWVNGAGDPQRQAAPYHPFAEEQAAVADLLADLLADVLPDTESLD